MHPLLSQEHWYGHLDSLVQESVKVWIRETVQDDLLDLEWNRLFLIAKVSEVQF